MENQGKRIEIHTNNVHSPKRYLPSGTNKSYQHSTKGTGQIPRIKLCNELNWREHIIKKRKQMEQKPENSIGS
jgi:hypothetical protein